MINKIQTKLYFLSLSIFIVLIDQFTKYLMFYNKKLFINKDFLLFKLDFVKNYGAAFNIFSGNRILNGYVIDFINLNIINFPVFNIADISINIGFIFLFYSIFKNNQ